MVWVRAVGFLMNDPQRGHVALHALRDVFSIPPSVDGIGIGSCVDGSVLLSKLPSVPDDSSLSRLVGPLKGRVAVLQLRDASDLRPSVRSANNLGPYRFRAFACAVIGGPQTADEAMTLREKLLADLPDFLRRSVRGQTEGEVFFYAVLARLFSMGLLERGLVPPSAVVDAVLETRRAVGDDTPRHVALSTGVELVQVSRGMPSALLTLKGLDLAAADDLDPTLTDSSLGRERLRRFRAALTLGGLDRPFDEATPVPSGVQIRALSDDSQAVLGRDLEPHLL